MSKFVGRRVIVQDGYNAQSILKFLDLDIDGGTKNGLVKVNHFDNISNIEFPKYPDKICRIRYNLSIPNDYVIGTDIIVKIFWSPIDNILGNVRWRIRYKIMGSDIDDVSSPLVIVAATQSTSEIANRLTDTGDNLFIASTNIQKGDLLALNIERECSIIDTYNSTVRIHLVRLEYFGLGIK